MNDPSFRMKAFRLLHHYLTFLFLVSFVTTCCITLFVSVLSDTMGLEFMVSDIETTAKLTLLNVMLLSLIFMIVDIVRRRHSVYAPAKEIIDASERIMQGDFSTRIPAKRRIMRDENFDRIAECFNNMAAELESVETLRTDFISNVSHEMKTPLAVIRNYATLLQSKDLSADDRDRYASAIVDCTNRMSEMMGNILQLNRLENQQIYPSVKEFDLTEQVCGCLLQFESIWEESGIGLETDVDEPVMIRADEELLSIVWNNLLSNAFKFTDSGGKVEVSVSRDGDHAVVTIGDSGCGMSKEVGERIFDKFYQGDRSRSVKGNGLGLALVKRVIDIVHGEVTVESALGKGSRFTVRVPLTYDGQTI